MSVRSAGRYERVVAGGEEVSVFIPAPLPPANPPLLLEGKIADRLRLAEQALGRLDLAGEMVPSLDWFPYAFVRKEAVLSSQIEGTQATLLDLFTFEAEEQPAPDANIEEVCNYLDALAYARGQLADDRGLPLSMRLLGEAHRRLMSGVRGANKQPGEILAAARTGSAAAGRAMRYSCRRPRTSCPSFSVPWKNTSMATIRSRNWSAQDWLMCSSRPFTPISTEMAALAAC
jgi:hypothetical protein